MQPNKDFARTHFQFNLMIFWGSIIGASLHFIENVNLISYSLTLALTIFMILLMHDYDNKLRLLRDISSTLKPKNIVYSIIEIILTFGSALFFTQCVSTNLKFDSTNNFIKWGSNFFNAIIQFGATVGYTLAVTLILQLITSIILKTAFHFRRR
ncbi:hypothetical protein [Staphylococcus saprophyticus]|uniref:hypothetical protein n=1 Tax=Staphylococcus saprophyticus TaxID=29385 RepID=UPI0020401541|nr:hypothetical protein [Staphylococcus saprophyticus]MCM3121355.1 hypothetical protein [Staphylococcus saprophyticus]